MHEYAAPGEGKNQHVLLWTNPWVAVPHDAQPCFRLVFHCLLELCRCQAKGVVEHAVLLGTPVGVTPQRWRMARTVVAGRLVNGYSSQDWVCTRDSVQEKCTYDIMAPAQVV